MTAMYTNKEALIAIGRMIERARRARRLTTYQVAQTLGVDTWFVSSVESGNSSPYELEFERIVEFFGLPLKMVDACKSPKPARSDAAKSAAAPAPIGNVVDFRTYRASKWQKTSSLETD